MTVLLVALGAAIGAPLRHLVGRAIPSRLPWATLIVNVIGSLILGFVVGRQTNPHLTALVGTGFCGALTTYSTFGWETMTLARRKAHRLALANVAVSIVAGLAAAATGLFIA